MKTATTITINNQEYAQEYTVLQNVNIHTETVYKIYYKSAKHPRTINTPTMGRTYYSTLTVKGNNLLTTILEFIKVGKVITDIRTIDTKILVSVDDANKLIYIVK